MLETKADRATKNYFQLNFLQFLALVVSGGAQGILLQLALLSF